MYIHTGTSASLKDNRSDSNILARDVVRVVPALRRVAHLPICTIQPGVTGSARLMPPSTVIWSRSSRNNSNFYVCLARLSELRAC